MDKNLIEQLAAEADPGFMYGKESDGTMLDSLVGIEAIYRFAALVAAHEREQCALVCLEHRTLEYPRASLPQVKYEPANTMAEACAAAIRARGDRTGLRKSSPQVAETGQ